MSIDQYTGVGDIYKQSRETDKAVGKQKLKSKSQKRPMLKKKCLTRQA